MDPRSRFVRVSSEGHIKVDGRVEGNAPMLTLNCPTGLGSSSAERPGGPGGDTEDDWAGEA